MQIPGDIATLKKLGFILFCCVAIFSLQAQNAFAYVIDGTIKTSDEHAWSENVGWINFGTTQGNVHVTDSKLTGYAWGENIGWVSLDCTNDNSCATADYGVKNDSEGHLSGYAWSENVGWINFNPTNGGVTIDSNGVFSGYAWGENIGWVSLNCTNDNSCATADYRVATDWQASSTRICTSFVYSVWNDCFKGQQTRLITSSLPVNCSGGKPILAQGCNGGSTLPPVAFIPPPPPAGGFIFLINGGAAVTSSTHVQLSLNGGAYTTRVSISNSPDFRGASQELYRTAINWTLTEGEEPKTVYAKFYNQHGISTDAISATIAYTTATSTPAVSSALNNSPASSSVAIIIRDIPLDFRFTKNLRYGASGNDVRYLQLLLKAQGANIYPEGSLTGLFGKSTTKAVIRFQEKYSSEILTPLGLLHGSGNVGKATRTKLNTLLETYLPQ